VGWIAALEWIEQDVVVRPAFAVVKKWFVRMLAWGNLMLAVKQMN